MFISAYKVPKKGQFIVFLGLYLAFFLSYLLFGKKFVDERVEETK